MPSAHVHPSGASVAPGTGGVEMSPPAVVAGVHEDFDDPEANNTNDDGFDSIAIIAAPMPGAADAAPSRKSADASVSSNSPNGGVIPAKYAFSLAFASPSVEEAFRFSTAARRSASDSPKFIAIAGYGIGLLSICWQFYVAFYLFELIDTCDHLFNGACLPLGVRAAAAIVAPALLAAATSLGAGAVNNGRSRAPALIVAVIACLVAIVPSALNTSTGQTVPLDALTASAFVVLANAAGGALNLSTATSIITGVAVTIYIGVGIGLSGLSGNLRYSTDYALSSPIFIPALGLGGRIFDQKRRVWELFWSCLWVSLIWSITTSAARARERGQRYAFGAGWSEAEALRASGAAAASPAAIVAAGAFDTQADMDADAADDEGMGDIGEGGLGDTLARIATAAGAVAADEKVSKRARARASRIEEALKAIVVLVDAEEEAAAQQEAAAAAAAAAAAGGADTAAQQQQEDEDDAAAVAAAAAGDDDDDDGVQPAAEVGSEASQDAFFSPNDDAATSPAAVAASSPHETEAVEAAREEALGDDDDYDEGNLEDEDEGLM